MFVAISRPGRNPVWSSLIIFPSTFFILYAMDAEAILYATFSSEIGRQFFKYDLSLLPFGIHVVTNCY